MTVLRVPPVPDLASLKGNTVSELERSVRDWYARGGAPFNYANSVRAVRTSYSGYHNIERLLDIIKREKTELGRKCNEQVISLAAPFAFGRDTQVFDLPKRKFKFGRNREAAYRVPFFIVEDGIIKPYYLQPSKTRVYTRDELGMIATIHKRHILDQEFFGRKVDVEFVTLSADTDPNVRETHRLTLSDLDLWSDDRLQARLTLISEAIDRVEAAGAPAKARRPARTLAPELPLFD